MGQFADEITNTWQPLLDGVNTRITEYTAIKNACDACGTFTVTPADETSPTPSEADFLSAADIWYGSSDTSDNSVRAYMATQEYTDLADKDAWRKTVAAPWQHLVINNWNALQSEKTSIENKIAELQAKEDAL